jgi:hypothetical protein
MPKIVIFIQLISLRSKKIALNNNSDEMEIFSFFLL